MGVVETVAPLAGVLLKTWRLTTNLVKTTCCPLELLPVQSAKATPPTDAVPSIKAPLLLHYAGLDQQINAGIPAYEAALKQAGKVYTIEMYPNVNHAFNNDTAAARYDKPAADLAWGRTIAFFKKYLGPGLGSQ